MTELGLRQFAIGDRVYFLRNEHGLGVKNGTLGTLVAIEGEGEAARLTIRLDAKDRRTGEQKLVAFPLAEYAHLDHGYAATIHKTQGVTADRTHVLATAGMDRHLAYVALSRHREDVTLHWSEESFVSSEGLVARLSRERAKDTTLDYGESEEELCAVYAERRGLQPLAPTSERSAGHPAVTARDRLRRVGLAHEIKTVVSALLHVIEAQKTVIAGIAEALIRPMIEPKQTPAPRDMFDGLVLNVAPIATMAPAAAPAPSPLTAALAAFLKISRECHQMEAAASPLLPYHKEALERAGQKIEMMRPGFLKDILVAGQRQPEVIDLAVRSDEGIGPLIVAVVRVSAERTETVKRQAEQEALAPIRERLLKERMDSWWRETHPYIYSFERSQRMRDEAKPVEAAFKQEIEAMAAAELRRIEQAWAEVDRIQKAAPAPRSSGPSPF